jgi:hypothetical protein
MASIVGETAYPVRTTACTGRHCTPMLLASSTMPPVLLTIERHRVEDGERKEAIAARPADAPTLVVRSDQIVALRQRPVVALGALLERVTLGGERLVTAHDVTGRACWIPADAVWSDAEHTERPQRPRPVGLATAPTAARAFGVGISDRLGWEAVLAFERGEHLPAVDADAGRGTSNDRLVVLDGRLDHDVPTVVVLGDDFVRWGAAATWSTAVHRALYGDDGSIAVDRELGDITAALQRDSLDVVGVDLGTALLRRAGVIRCSVQLVVRP